MQFPSVHLSIATLTQFFFRAICVPSCEWLILSTRAKGLRNEQHSSCCNNLTDNGLRELKHTGLPNDFQLASVDGIPGLSILWKGSIYALIPEGYVSGQLRNEGMNYIEGNEWMINENEHWRSSVFFWKWPYGRFSWYGHTGRLYRLI